MNRFAPLVTENNKEKGDSVDLNKSAEIIEKPETSKPNRSRMSHRRILLLWRGLTLNKH